MIRSVRQSFAAGELAPELHMRSDLGAYQKGAAKLRNMIVRRTGSAMKRPGTDVLEIGEFKSGDTALSPVRMFPFYYDEDTSFAVLIAPSLVKVYEVSPEFRYVTQFGWSPLASWSSASVAAMRVKQVGDTLFCSAPGRAPIRLIRNASSGSWSFAAEPRSGPPAYTSASGNWSAVWTGPETGAYRHVMYGLWARDQSGQLKNLWKGGEVQVKVAWPAGATVQFSVAKSSIPAAAVGHEWVLCKFYGGEYGEIGSHLITGADRTGTGSLMMFEDLNIIPTSQIGTQTDIRAADDSGGYGIVDFFQQRQVLAGNTAAPWTLWFSRLADLYQWAANRPTDAMDPFRATIAASRASKILHLVSGRRLLVMTTDGVYAIHSNADGFSPGTCQIERVNPVGAAAVEPVDTGASVLFFATDERTLMEMRYSFAEDAHVAVDRSVLARHLTEAASVRSAAWQAWPDGVLWIALDDGSLVSFTYLPEHEVFAFARHDIRLTGAAVGIYITEIAATGSLLRDETVFAPRRDATTATVALGFNGSADPVKYFLLRMRPGGRGSDACVDCARKLYRGFGAAPLSVSLAAGDVWRCGASLETAGWHTAEEAREVEVPETSWIEWGTPVEAELETLKPEAPDLAAQALRRRTVSVTVRTLDSGAYSVADAAGGPAVEVSGSAGGAAAHDAKLPPISGYDWDGRIKITSAGTGKLEVLGVISDIEIEGGR